MASRYKMFLRLCEQWPLDPLKKGPGRDLGQRVREGVVGTFKNEEATQLEDLEKCDRMYKALEDIRTDRHRRDFPTKTNYLTGVAGMELDNLRIFTSDENLKLMEKRSRRLWHKVYSNSLNFFQRLARRFT